MEDRCSGNFFCQAPYMFFPIWMGLAVLMLTIYHCVVLGLKCCLRAQSPVLQPSNRPENLEGPISIENSRVQLIQVHSYKKGMVLVGEDSMCAVCLCEFQQGEELRTLPECMHSYHAPCIDMSLYSHPNCPVCRTNTTQPQQILSQVADSDSVRLATGMLQSMIIQSRAL